jgi:hypothetical protein
MSTQWYINIFSYNNYTKMSKSNIDYSNTIVYKITCKDPNIQDVYVGHTVNFVQRKKAHQLSCMNSNYPNHNCKVYEVMRGNIPPLLAQSHPRFVATSTRFRHCNPRSDLPDILCVPNYWSHVTDTRRCIRGSYRHCCSVL